MKELKPEMMGDILDLAKKLPKGSKMEIEIPEKGSKKESEDGVCPECGAKMDKEKELSTDELREKLKG